METRYTVVFAGKIMPGQALPVVKQQVAALYKTTVAKIDPLFSGRAVTIKTGCDAAAASKIQAAFKRAGAICTLEPEAAQAPQTLSLEALSAPTPSSGQTQQPSPRPARAASRTTAAPSQAICPQCGHKQAQAYACLYCGHVFQHHPSGPPSPPVRGQSRIASGNAAKSMPSPAPLQKVDVVITLEFFALAFLLFFCTPVVEIDGEPYRRKWGRHVFRLTPGLHIIRVYFPYLGWARCGENVIDIEVPAGETCTLAYWMPPWIFAKGTLKAAYPQRALSAAQQRCPKCQYEGMPKAAQRLSKEGWISFVVLLLLFWPLCWLPFVMQRTKAEVLKCGRCGTSLA